MASEHVALVTFLVFCVFIANNLFQTHGFSINLVPIEQVDKSLFPQNLTLEERYQRISAISKSHVYQLQSIPYSSSAEQNEIVEYKPSTLQPIVSFENPGLYLAKVLIGWPPYGAYLLVDTGSDDTWVQCEGCTECFHIQKGNFKRNESGPYKALRCNDSLCYPRLCVNDHCVYDITYSRPGSRDCSSKGEVGVQSFRFRDNKGNIRKFPGTVFGCGFINRNFLWGGASNDIAGVLGLGAGPRSILSQYRKGTKMRMSYCLPARDASNKKLPVLSFGDEARIRGRASTIRLVPHITKYAINVTDISVAGTRLGLNPEIFRMRPDLTGGFVLDTGSFETVLVRTAYNAVRNEFVRVFERNHGWHPKPPQRQQRWDLCYDAPVGNGTALPNMTYHFEGADLALHATNIFIAFNTSFCLMMMPINDGGTNILGSFQQANFRFLFDFFARRFSFASEVCA